MCSVDVTREISKSEWFGRIAASLFLVFPLGMGVARSWASGVTLLLFVVALLAIWLEATSPPMGDVRPLVIGATIYVVAILASFVNADDLPYSISRMIKYLPLIFSVVLVAGFRRLRNSLMAAFVKGLVLTGPIMLVVAVHAIWWKELPRAQGYYHPIVFAELSMVVSLLLVCALMCKAVPRGWAVLAGISLTAALVASLLAESRGTWFALPVTLLLLTFMFRDRIKTKGILVGLTGPVILLLFLPVLMPHSVGEQIARTCQSIECFVDGTEQNTSLGQRILMWQIAVDIWGEHPLIGSGLGDFQNEAEKRIASGETPLNKAWMHAHSIYFESLSTTGTLGFLSLVFAFFLIPLGFFYRRWGGSSDPEKQFAALAGLILVCCFATFGLSEAWTTRSPLINSYALMLSLFLSQVGGKRLIDERALENNL